MLARDYDPRTGRFLSSDPATGVTGVPLTFNRYVYANDDPVNHTDPTGRQETTAELGAEFGVISTLSSISLPSFTSILASTQVQLFVAGALTAAGAVAIAHNPAAVQQLEREWELFKRAIAAAAATLTFGIPLFHYTSQEGAMGILATQEIWASPEYSGDGFTHPTGAYATEIPPVGPFTRTELQALYKKGNANFDVSWFVMLGSNMNAFYPTGYPAEWVSPAPYPGVPVPVRTWTIGPNLMLP